MLVDARSGSLVSFDFVSEKASTREAALNGVINQINSRAAGYVDRLIQFRLSILILPSKSSGDSSLDLIEDIPDEASARSKGFKPPQFLNHVKPEYTREAESADVTATVEARVVFRSVGEVGNIEITRWAGFGLENSAMRAIRQLKFKPATRDGKAISATIRSFPLDQEQELEEYILPSSRTVDDTIAQLRFFLRTYKQK